MAMLAMLGIFFDYMIQTILAVPMVAMVGYRGGRQEATNDVCPLPIDVHNTTQPTKVGEFDWDEKTQGIIQGCIYYGFALVSIPGGRLAEVFGGKRMFGLMLASGCLLVLVSPAAAYSSTWLFIAVRVMQGVVIGGMFPAVNIVVVNWFPPAERSKFISIIMAGANLGNVTCMVVAGWLCELGWLGGWPAPFYVVGVAGLVWTALWFCLVHATPEEHPQITHKELHYILGGSKRVKEEVVQSKVVPWGVFLRTPALWVVTLAAMGDAFSLFFFFTMIPTYLTNIQHFSLQSAGVIAALPQLLSCVACSGWGFVVGRLTATRTLTTRRIRQLSTGLAFYVPAACMLGMTVVGCDKEAAVVLLILCLCVNTFNFGGYFSSMQDLSPMHCGTTVGFICTFSSLCAVMGPMVAGLIINERQTLGAWRDVFITSASIYIVCCTIYIIFTPGRQQHWETPHPSPPPSPPPPDAGRALLEDA